MQSIPESKKRRIMPRHSSSATRSTSQTTSQSSKRPTKQNAKANATSSSSLSSLSCTRASRAADLLDQCELPVQDTLKLYLEQGWKSLTTIFDTCKDVSGKTKTTVPATDRMAAARMTEALSMLAGVRKYAVLNAFQCAKPDQDTSMHAFGSTNLTSDYDVTLVGVDAAKVAWRMFKQFYKAHKDVLPRVFDTNIYCIGLFLTSHVNSKHKRQFMPTDNPTYSTYVAHADDAKDFLVAAGAKVSATMKSNDVHKFPITKTLLAASRLWLQANETTLKKQVDALSRLPSTSTTPLPKTDESRELYARYKLQSKYGAKALDMAYAKSAASKSRSEFVKSLLKANFFATEAYFTLEAVNVVVLTLQKKDRAVKKHLTPISYLCTALECLGDFRSHTLADLKSDSPQTTGPLLINGSKYVFRVLHSLEQLATFSKSAVRPFGTAALVEANVVAVRGKNVVATVASQNKSPELDLLSQYMGFKHKTAQEYVQDFTAHVLACIEKELARLKLAF